MIKISFIFNRCLSIWQINKVICLCAQTPDKVKHICTKTTKVLEQNIRVILSYQNKNHFPKLGMDHRNHQEKAKPM